MLALLDKVFVQGRVVFGMCVERLPFLEVLLVVVRFSHLATPCEVMRRRFQHQHLRILRNVSRCVVPGNSHLVVDVLPKVRMLVEIDEMGFSVALLVRAVVVGLAVGWRDPVCLHIVNKVRRWRRGWW